MQDGKPQEHGQPEKGTAALRRHNREWLVSLIARSGPVTRGTLAGLTGLTGAAISRITRELIDAKLVREGDPIAVPGRVGRREYNLSINPTGAFFLGISLTANRRSVSLANADGEVLRAADCSDIPIDDPLAFLTELGNRAKTLAFDEAMERDRLLGVGVSFAMSAGPDSSSGNGLISSEPLGWKDVPVRDTLSQSLNLPVQVEHRASAILCGELLGGQELKSVYLINAALGLGNSAYFDGRFLTTTDRGFGDLSHYSTSHSDKLCTCGRTGCMEVAASGKAILNALGSEFAPSERVATRLAKAIEAANAGDPSVRTHFRDAGTQLSYGVDAILSLFDPESVIVAGEVGRQADYYQGLVDGLEKVGRPNARDIIMQSSITSEEAAVSVALQNFLYSGSLIGTLTHAL